TATEKWRYWRADLADGSQVSVDVSDAKGKTRLSAKIDKLLTMEDRDRVKEEWRALLTEFSVTVT
ncbi:MAG TPA: hypothetical protein K8V93_04230, partial [Corynebacterium pollutisoli]|nr:hypothetical protein [Corynebacterium pollutisoli]